MRHKRVTPEPYVQPYRYPSPHIPLAAIRRFARQIARRFQPEKIILFGSYAYGTPHDESDVDLLVIMPTHDVVAQEIRIGLELDRPFSHDIVVRTPQQVARGLKQNNWFLREVIAKGKVLYDARKRYSGSVTPKMIGKWRMRSPREARLIETRLASTSNRRRRST